MASLAPKTQEQVWRKFQRYTIKMTEDEAHTFWNDIHWLYSSVNGLDVQVPNALNTESPSIPQSEV
jgi:hypothetical protein